MSVVLEKDKIIITIPTANPVDELHHFQKNLLGIFQDLQPDYAGDTYHAYWLAKEMVPDGDTYKSINKERNFDAELFEEAVSDLRPHDMRVALINAQRFLFLYAATLNNRDTEIEKTVERLKAIEKAIEKGEKATV